MGAIQFINISPEEFKNSIVAELLQSLKPEPQEELLTILEVAEFYKVSKPTIERWAKKGIIKTYSISNELRCKKSELMANIKLVKQKQ